MVSDNRHSELAEKFSKHENYVEATREYLEAIQAEPSDPNLYIHLGEVLVYRRQYQEAAEKYWKAIELDADSAAYKGLAGVLPRLIDSQRVEKCTAVEKRIAGVAKSAAAYEVWIEALYKSGLYSEAAEILKKTASLDPANAWAVWNWGACLVQMGKQEEALKKYEEALKIDPASPRWHKFLAEELFQAGSYFQAMEHFLMAMEQDVLESIDYAHWNFAWDHISRAEKETIQTKLDQDAAKHPELAAVYLRIGQNFYAQERYPEAIEQYEKAHKTAPSSQSHWYWADALSRQGNHGEAITHYLEAIGLGPGDANQNFDQWTDAFDNLSLAERDEVIRKLEEIVQANPENALFYKQWGLKLYGLERYPEAAARFEQAAKALPSDGAIQSEWADALFAQGQEKYEAATEHYLQALSPVSAADGAPHKLIMALLGLPPAKQRATAARLEQIIAEYPQRGRVYSTWAGILYNQEKFDQAAKKYQEALKSAPEDSEALAGLAKALTKQKKYAEAAVQFSRAAKIDLKSVDDDLWFQAIDLLPQAEREKKYLEISGLLLRSGADGLASIKYNRWGRVLDALGKTAREGEIEKLHQLARNKPEAAQVYYLWGESCYSRKQYPEASERNQKACELNPEYVAAYLAWGDALRESRQYPEAVEKYRKVIDLPAAEEADQANAWAALGVLNYIRKIYNEAITQSRKALDLNPAHRFAYRTCGDVFYQRKQYAEAASLYEKHITQAAQTDVNSYLVWGAALLAAKKEAEAIQKYEQAIAMDADTESSLAERYYYWGNALTGENRIEEGIEKYRKANSIAPDYVYAHHNLAFYLQAQGRYSESWAKWEETIPIYRRGIEEARKNGNSEYFRYFGGVLVDLKHPDAEDVYLQGLELNPDYLDILTDLVGLYLDQRDELVKPDHRPDHHGRTRANSKARECYRKAEELLKRDFALAEDPWIFVQWGQLYVNMGEYDKAAVQFQKAVEQDSESAEPLNQLGVLFSRKEDFAKAIQYFEQALQRDPDNLMIKNNLAEAYLKGGKLDKAEAEYKRILSITANHVESEIGLGQVYTAMAEGCRDGDFYDEAIHHFKRAIDMAKNNSSKVSKKMTSQEWAAVYYASGYARVKLHGSSKTIKDDRLLWDARKDFKQSLNYDKEHHKAERAAKKITEKLRPFSPERFLEKVGPMTILAMSAFVFVLVQISFLRKGMFHDLAFYVPVTFGSIILMIAGFYLPRLLKLKVAGIELEKSSVDQITSAGSVEISQ